MKKLIWSVALVLALAAVAYWLYNKGGVNTTMEELAKEYTIRVEDTAAVTRIVLQDKSPSRTELIRVNGQWLVNGEAPARTDAIEVLLETIYRVELKNFVPEKTKNEILNRIATYGIEVEVYAGEEQVRHFYVGAETQDQLGTYMMNHDASQPFAMYMPGFNGYLSTRFFTRPEMWRDRIMFGWEPNQIKSIALEYPKEGNGFTLVQNESEWNVANQQGAPLQANPSKSAYYAALFKTLKYEGAITPDDPIYARKDSLLANTPVFILTVAPKEGETKVLKAFRIKAAEDAVDSEGNPREFDPDRLHGVLNNGDMVLLQYFGLQQVLIPNTWFIQ